MKIFYMGLESYQARYTYQLTDWTERVYKKRGIDYVIVPVVTDYLGFSGCDQIMSYISDFKGNKSYNDDITILTINIL